MKNLTITQKIATGFAVLLTGILAYTLIVYLGVNGIILNAKEVISGYQLNNTLAHKEIDHLNWVNKITVLITNEENNTLDLQVDDHKCGFGRWLYGDARKLAEVQIPSLAVMLKNIEKPHYALHQTAIAIKKVMLASDSRQQWLPDVEKIYTTQTLPALSDIQSRIGDISSEAAGWIISDEAMLAAAKRVKSFGLMFGGAAFVLGIAFSFFITRSLSSVLKRITDGITTNAKEVQAAAGELTLISRELAGGASVQSSNMENISASLEEMTSVSRETSTLTSGVEKLMNVNIERSGQSLKSLVALSANMTKIEQDSDKISQIISTIDGISFQTNLLALNAAVEAARAGEAGAGFAVVADEVKNLAMRSADAAKSTQELLDKTLARIAQGSKALQGINDDFDQIVSSATNIGDKSMAITRATVEQSQGIEQVSVAAQEIEGITVGLVDHASSASVESVKLSGQAEEMRIVAKQLAKMVYGRKGVSSIGVSGKEATPCWEEKNCPPERRDSCPAYPDSGNECWTVTATQCGGQEQGSFHEKLENCKKCIVYQKCHEEDSGQSLTFIQ